MILLCTFLISFSGLMLEVTITRIFSTTIWYHYAFVAISVALFGWGFGGLFLHFLRRRLYAKVFRISVIMILLFSISIPLYIWVIFQFPMSPSYLSFYYVASIVPFFLGGICISFLFDHFANIANKIYFADLTGASFACLCLEPALAVFGAESTALMLGVTGSVAGLCLSFVSKKRKLIAISMVGFAITSSIFLSNSSHTFIGISNAPTKKLFQDLKSNPELRIVLTRWNSFSRIDVVEGRWDNLATIYIDADATTDILNWDGDIASTQYLKKTMDFIPYNLTNKPKALIIGSGGGRDVIIALVGESSKVVAVELNPIIVEATKSYGARAGNVYDQDKVEAIIDEGRSFISRSNEKYDVIMLSLVDSWAAIAAGGYALAENYLYTLEAFHQYLDHLTDDGMLVMIRWLCEVPRLVSTSVVALEARGYSVQEVGKHIAIVLNEADPSKVKSLFILKKTPFNITHAENIEKWVSTIGDYHRVFYLPYIHAEAQYSELFNGKISLDQFYASFPNKADPVTDDDPYFFNWEWSIPKALNDLIILTLLAATAIISVPWIIRKRRSHTNTESVLSFVIYFAFLGFAYMLVEIALLQKFILFLGYPTRSLSVILFSLLLSSGIGSFVSGWISKKNIVKNVLLACPLIIILVIGYALTLPSLFGMWLQQDAAIRILVSVVLLFPLGFFMGIPFPTGLRILAASSDQNVPWMWGINGAMSVFGSILATTVGIVWGFGYALILGALVYSATMICAWFWFTKQT